MLPQWPDHTLPVDWAELADSNHHRTSLTAARLCLVDDDFKIKAWAKNFKKKSEFFNHPVRYTYFSENIELNFSWDWPIINFFCELFLPRPGFDVSQTKAQNTIELHFLNWLSNLVLNFTPEYGWRQIWLDSKETANYITQNATFDRGSIKDVEKGQKFWNLILEKSVIFGHFGRQFSDLKSSNVA